MLGLVVMAIVMMVMMMVMMRNTHLEAQDKCINRSVKYVKVDEDKSGAGGRFSE